MHVADTTDETNVADGTDLRDETNNVISNETGETDVVTGR